MEQMVVLLVYNLAMMILRTKIRKIFRFCLIKTTRIGSENFAGLFTADSA